MNGLPNRLPAPCENGHYWLGGSAPRRLPAIFQIASRKSVDEGKYMVCPEVADVPFREGKIMAFDTPEQALAALHAMAKRGLR